jgi:hypothetical protein
MHPSAPDTALPPGGTAAAAPLLSPAEADALLEEEAEAPDEELDEEPDEEPDEELDEPVDEPEAVAVPVAADSLLAVLLASP